MRTCFLAILYLLWFAPYAAAQNMREGGSDNSARAKKQFEFEVFSIRPHKPGSTPFDQQFTPNGYIQTTDLAWAIKLAYFPPDPRKWSSWKIQNAPSWVTNDWYDVEARVAPEDLQAWQAESASWKKSPDIGDMRLLRSAWQAALKDRCKLAVHFTSTTAAYLDLMVNKHGGKLEHTVPGAVKPVKLKTRKLGEGFFIEDKGERHFVGVSMEEFAVLLTGLSATYPVQDKTNLAGRFNFALPWYDYQNYPDTEFSDPLDRMPVSSAGLILKRGKGPAYVINIDHIEKPDPN